VADPAERFRRATDDSQAQLDAIAAQIREHLPCGYEPCETCTRFVPGEGDPRAEVVLIGEAPGAEEDRAGRPFVGRAGRLLDQVLETAGLPRERVFITNVLKARPPGNRDPRADEIDHHLPWLLAQLEIIRPALVVPLGRHALQLLGDRDDRISRLHGELIERNGRTLFPLYHPSAALRAPPVRDLLFEDAERLARTLDALASASAR
jgi:DNA polymerase